MKKYHIFTNKYNKNYVALGDHCIYCKASSDELYYSLNEIAEKYPSFEENTYSDTLNTIAEEHEFYAIHKPCIKGLTEEEYIIKGILE
jgi:hypothetical protein